MTAHEVAFPIPLTVFKAFLDLASGKVPMCSWADLICLVTYTISV
jgi:hypothetical protein